MRGWNSWPIGRNLQKGHLLFERRSARRPAGIRGSAEAARALIAARAPLSPADLVGRVRFDLNSGERNESL